MGTREKILVGLMILALLYGVFEVFIATPDESSPEKKSGPDIEAARKMTEKIDSRVEQAKLTPLQKNTLELAGRPWERDPFYLLPEQEAVSTTDTGQNNSSESIKYTGFLEIGSTRMAILNGVEYRIGERLEKGGGVVKRISPGQVIIESATTGGRFSVPYSE